MSDTASRDANNVPTIQGVSSIDLKTPVNIAVNPSTGALLIDSSSIGGSSNIFSLSSPKGINYYHEGMGYISRTSAQMDADYADMISKGTTHIRIVANPMVASHAQAVLAIQRAKAAGLIVLSGANFDQPNDVVYSSGTASSGSATTLVDTTKTWTVNEYAGFEVYITSGTGSGQTGYIVSNTNNTLTVAAQSGFATFSPSPDATSVYKISFQTLTQNAWQHANGYSDKVIALAVDFKAAGADYFDVGNEINTHRISTDTFTDMTTNALQTAIKTLAAACTAFAITQVGYASEFYTVGYWASSGIGSLGHIGFNFYGADGNFFNDPQDAYNHFGTKAWATEWSTSTTFGGSAVSEIEWTRMLSERKGFLAHVGLLSFAFAYRETTDDGFGYLKSIATGGEHDAWQNAYGLNHLSEAHDVFIENPANTQVLTWDSTNKYWKAANNGPVPLSYNGANLLYTDASYVKQTIATQNDVNTSLTALTTVSASTRGINYYHESMSYISRNTAQIDADMADMVAHGATDIRLVTNPMRPSTFAQTALICTRAKLAGLTVLAGANFDGRGEITYVSSTATGGSASTLIDSGKTWTVNQWVGFQVYISGGTGNGQAAYITANTATTLTVAAVEGFNLFSPSPDATSVYFISFEKLAQKPWEYASTGYAAEVLALAVSMKAAGADYFSVGNEIAGHVTSQETFLNATNRPTNIKALASAVVSAGTFTNGQMGYAGEFWTVGEWGTSGIGSLGFIGFNFYSTFAGMCFNIQDALSHFPASQVWATEWSTSSTFGGTGDTEMQWTYELSERRKFLESQAIGKTFAFTYRETTDTGFGYLKSVATGGAHDAWDNSFGINIKQSYADYGIFFNSSMVVQMPDATTWDATTSFTVEAFINTNSRSARTYERIVKKDNQFILSIVSGRLSCEVWTANGHFFVDSGGNITEGVNLHVALTYDGTNLNLYQAGVRLAQIAATGNMVHSTNVLTIGNADSTAEMFDGFVEQVRISNSLRYTGATYTAPTARFVTDANTKGLWALDDLSTTIVDSSGNANSGTLSGTSATKFIPGIFDTITIAKYAVVAPALATDNAIARFDGTTGRLVQNSLVTLDDTGNLILKNDAILQGDDSGGIARNIAFVDDTDIMQLGDIGLSGFLFNAGGDSRLVVGDTNVTVKGYELDVIDSSFNHIFIVSNPEGNVLNTGYLRVGSVSTPSNTTAGDLTFVRGFGSSLSLSGSITTATWAGATVGVSVGGTGQTSYTNGQLLIGNTSGNTLAKATLTAGVGISVTNGAGAITIASTSPGQIILTAAGGTPSVTSGCTAPVQVETATNKVNYWNLTYAASVQSYAEWSMALPSDYNGGTLTAVFYWLCTNASTNSVVWGIQAVNFANNVVIDTAYGTAQTVTQANGAAGVVNMSSATAAMTIGGSTPAAGQHVQFRVYRLGSGSDTLLFPAALLEVRLTYTKT